MHTIWSEVMRADGRHQREQRKALAQERDDAIAALMTEDLRPQYENILKEYNRKMDELGQERTQAFEQAVEQTRKILTPEQAGKYDALLKKQREQSPGEPSGLRPPWGEGRRPRPGSEEGTPEKEAVPRGGE
jgi:Spy/CpxP family protein refolding chaperone